MLREDHQSSEKGCCILRRKPMKLVTYEAGSGPRVGALVNGEIVDLGFDGDMVAFIEAGAPKGNRTPVKQARLLAPLRPRSLRDFLTFEGHLHNAMTRLGRPIAPEWYEVPVYYKGMPDTVIGPEERSEEHTSELQSHSDLVCRLLLEKKNMS